MTDSAASGIRAQLGRHAVALISLAVAMTGLGYNTWRNEATEAQRNIRQAAFASLGALGELQRIADLRFFAASKDSALRIGGWAEAATTRDLGALICDDARPAAQAVFTAWAQHGDALDRGDEEAEKRIAESISAAREATLKCIASLD